MQEVAQHMHLKFHLFCIFPDFPEKKKLFFTKNIGHESICVGLKLNNSFM